MWRSYLILAGLVVVGAGLSVRNLSKHENLSRLSVITPTESLYKGDLTKTQRDIVEGARDQLTWGTVYDAEYAAIGYPNGDVDRKKGACTDVVIRSLRHAGVDLQAEIHKDICAHWGLYPRHQYNPKPDPNIDHRRVPNQKVFFARFGKTLPRDPNNPKVWQPGDIVEWKLPFEKDHTGVLTDHVDVDGFPLVIHNIGAGPAEEDVLRAWKISGHFRFPKT